MRKHPYISSTVIATLLAIVVWLIVPKEYTAITKLSDEYKEVDLAIGLDRIQARINELHTNDGINDMEVYSKLLVTEDFARSISHKQVPGKGMDYGHWVMQGRHFWQTKDTIEAIQDRINYNYRRKQETLVVSFSDREATVAALMLDSVTGQLQRIINGRRHALAEASLNNAKREQRDAEEKYRKAQTAYSDYFDSHQGTSFQSEKQQMQFLEKEVSLNYDNYEKATKNCIRQQALLQRTLFAFAAVKANTVPLHNNSFLVGYLLVFILASLLLTKAYYLYKERSREPWHWDFGDISSPWMITILVWAAVLVGMMFKDTELLKDPTEQFYISLAWWLPLFCISAFITYILMKRNNQTTGTLTALDLTDINRKVFYFLLFFSFVMTPIYIKKIIDVVLIFGTEDLMYNIREYSIFGDAPSGILSYSIVVNKALLLIAVWKFKQLKWWQMTWIYVANILNTLAIMEKGGFFLIFFCLVFVLFQRKIIKARSIILLGAVLMLLFYMFNLLRAKEGSSYQENETFFGFIAMYILSPPVAYCEIARDVTPQFGGHTFSLIYVFLNRFGLGPYEIFDRLQEFVYVPLPTNVYTIFQPFFLDFGYSGVAAFAIVYGVFSGITYRMMRNGNDFGKCMYVYVAHILVLQFFQENVFTVNLHVIQLAFLVYLCTQRSFSLSKSVDKATCRL